ncbi:MAG TPA: Fic family protein [Labilithrix sp.]|nr:Fic family protein [Labilithrix sp.]
MSSDDPLFLDAEDVVEIHATQLEVYGGSAGLRDRGLLESAVAQPQASFGGAFAHDGLFEMAAAYLFHIVRTIRSSTGTSAPDCSRRSSSSTLTASASPIRPTRSTS